MTNNRNSIGKHVASAQGMKTLSRSLVLLVMFVTSNAFADGTYISLGVAGDASVRTDRQIIAATEPAARLGIGRRIGPIAIEGSATGIGVGSPLATQMNEDGQRVSLGADLKYFVTLVGPLELFLRGGLHRAWLDDPVLGNDWQGNGFQYGTGLQVSFRVVPLLEAALWVDVSKEETFLRSTANDELDTEVRTILVGASFGSGL